MLFFNNTNILAFVYGHVIKPNDIYKIDNFNYVCDLIQNNILEPDIIFSLNNIFRPIKPKDNKPSLYTVEPVGIYDDVVIEKIDNVDDIVMYNNKIFSVAEFRKIYINQKITNKNVLLIDTNI
jgi:hypothetical protein